jgi:hypothetical protein
MDWECNQTLNNICEHNNCIPYALGYYPSAMALAFKGILAHLGWA